MKMSRISTKSRLNSLWLLLKKINILACQVTMWVRLLNKRQLKQKKKKCNKSPILTVGIIRSVTSIKMEKKYKLNTDKMKWENLI